MKLSKENRKKTSMKRLAVKASMFLLCVTGFLLHSYFRIRLFYEQEPITEHANERLENDNKDGELIKIPALSVCFSGSLFKRKPLIDSTLNNQLRSPLYYSQNKQRLPPNVALLDDLDTIQIDDDDLFALKRRQMASTVTNLKHYQRSANQMVSVDQAFGLMSKPRFSIKCDLIKPTKQRKLTRFTSNPLACEQIAQVIESINYELDQKCFTYFSQLQRSQDVEEDDFMVYRSDLNGGDLVQVSIHFDEDLSASKINQANVNLLIHSNVEMPNFQQMKTYSIRSSHNYMIYFNRLTYRRKDTNRSPCRLYKSKIQTNPPSMSYLQKALPIVLVDYQVFKNHFYKLFSGGEQQNMTKVDDQESQANDHEIGIKKATSKSQSDCIDKCHLETNKKYCICLPSGVNIRRELLSANDFFCDELRCLQDDLIQPTSITNSNLKKNNLNKAGVEQLEQLYSISNGQFVSKRYELFKKCIQKNDCITSCEEDKYDYIVNEKADINSIVQNILNILPTNTNRSYKNFKDITSEKFARNYYPDGFYYDPNYKQKQHITTASINKRFEFQKSKSKSAIDDLGKNFIENLKPAIQINDTKLNKSIIVQTPKQDQSSTMHTINIFTNLDTAADTKQSGQTIAMSGQPFYQFKTTTTLNTPVTTDELNTIESDIDDDIKYNQNTQDFTQSSINKYTSQNRKSLKFVTSTQMSTERNDNNRPTNDQSSSDQEDITMNVNIEERHNPLKSYQSLISFRNNRNANRLYIQRLSYSQIDLIFELALIGVLWLGFSVYIVADYVIYFFVFTFWYFFRLIFCIDWCFKSTLLRKGHRIIDSASSITQMTNQSSKISSKVSTSNEDLDPEPTFIKSIP